MEFCKDGQLVNIQKSFEALYDLSELTDGEQNILEAFSIFPYIPLSAEECNQWLLEDAGATEKDDILIQLYEKDWLQLDLEQENHAMHPVFARFIYKKCKPSLENHAGLVEVCQEGLKVTESGSAMKCQQYILFAEQIAEKLVMKNEIERAKFFSSIAYVFNYTGEYRKAEELYKKSLEIKERVLGENHPATAGSYNNLAVVYKRQGECNKALVFVTKAISNFSR